MTSVLRVAPVGAAFFRTFFDLNHAVSEDTEAAISNTIADESLDLDHAVLSLHPDDHYALLGCTERYAATEDIIKKNCNSLLPPLYVRP